MDPENDPRTTSEAEVSTPPPWWLLGLWPSELIDRAQ
jgi:hypothetical protein